MFGIYFIMPHRLRPLCQDSYSAKTNYSVNTALKCVGHSTSLFTFSSKQPWHPSTDWFSPQKPPRLVFICFETGMQFVLKWMDTDFGENTNNIARFERQKIWSHLQTATSFHSSAEHKQVSRQKKKKKKRLCWNCQKTFSRYTKLLTCGFQKEQFLQRDNWAHNWTAHS